MFSGDLIGDGGGGETQYNLGNDALPNVKTPSKARVPRRRVEEALA